VASAPPADLTLTPLNGQARPVEEWLTMFHMCLLVIDPYTNESAWILPVATRIVGTFEQADCRVAFLVAADERDARRFLGPWAREVLTFVDPDRTAIKAMGLERLPAVVHLGIDGTIVNSAEGWHPSSWRRVTDHLGKVMGWSAPIMGIQSDPGPFEGSPALS
jgi:hypothetical protein